MALLWKLKLPYTVALRISRFARTQLKSAFLFREGNTVADHFMTSVKMSTYTLAFMVSNYSATTNGIVSFIDRALIPKF